MSSINFRYDIVVSNPPYIASNDIKKLTEDVKSYDPLLSLDGGDDGS
jgi:release factor glutamine methyltransferase